MSTPTATDAPPPAPAEPSAGAVTRVRRLLVVALKTYQSHGMTDHAASLTYFAMLSLFPSLLAGIALLSIVGEASLATDAAEFVADNGADEATAEVVRSTLANLVETSGGAAGAALVISLLVALNGASGAFAASGRALNVVFAVDEDRGFVRRKLQDIGLALVVIALFAITVIAIVIGGSVSGDLLDEIGLGSTGQTIWAIVRWPVALAAAMLAFSIVYSYAPSTPNRRWRWVTPGTAGGVAIWIAASAGFAVYLQNFATYGAAYGAFGAAIVLLLWIYISANAFLLGAELDVTIERARQAGRGGPPAVFPPPSAARPAGGPPPPEPPPGATDES
jgi:membrane protein